MRRLALGLALIGCRTASKEEAAPPRARDAGAAPRVPTPALDAAVAAAPALPTLPAAERAALTGTIEVAAGREERFRVIALDPTGAASPRTLTPEGASYFPVPGRRSLAILTVDQGDRHTEQLVVLGATPADARPVGPASAHVRSPSVTRDGQTVIFEADSASFRDLYRLDLATDQVTRLTDDAAGNFEPSLSPDGARVAFTSSRDGDTEIYVEPVAGGPATRLTAFYKDDWQPAWSPDGAWIAFLSDREGAPRVFLVRPDGTGARHAHEGEVGGEEQEPIWSPDGRRVAYTVSTRAGASEVWWADVATGVAHRVSAAGARDEVPTWAPDGEHLVYVSTRDRRIDLWIGRADGTAETRLTDTPEEEWIPAMAPVTAGSQARPRTPVAADIGAGPPVAVRPRMLLRPLFVLGCVALLGGCALLTHPIEKPTVEVRGVAVTSISFNGIDGEVDLEIQNPNSFGVPLSAIDWQLSVGSAQAVSGRIELTETIPARGSAPVRATLHIGAMDAVEVGGEIARGVRTYQLAGRLTFTTQLGNVDVAVSSTGELGS